MNQQLQKYSLHIILAFTVCIYAVYWRDASIHVDERFTCILANGVELSSNQPTERIDTAYYNHITVDEFRKQNVFPNVVENVIADGGNGLLYYAFAHGASVTAGRFIGAFTAIKFLNVIFALCASVILYNLLKRYFNPSSVLFASILYAALSVQFAILNRNYGMSMLFFIIYLRQVIEYSQAPLTMKRRSMIILYASAIALPFIHFMNLPLMFFTASAAVITWKSANSNLWQLRHLAISHVIAAAIFAIFYFGYNKEGRDFQGLVNDYWSNFASQYGTQANNWLAPFSIRYAFIENIELLLRLTGLDLRDSFPKLRISVFIWLILIPIVLALITYLKLYRLSDKNVFRTITFSIFIAMGYIGFLNILYYIADHAIPLNSQWYSSSLFVCISLISASVYQYTVQPHLKKLLGFLLVIVIINSISQGLHPVHKDTNDPCMKVVMDLTEKQFTE